MKIVLIVLLTLVLIGCGCIHFGLMQDCHYFRDCQKYPKPVQTF